MFSNYDIGSRISSARNQRGLTLDEVANAIGVAKSTVQRYEKGTISRIKLPVIESIARVLQVDPNWIIGNTDTPSSDTSSFSVPSANEWILTYNEQQLIRDYRSLNPQGQAAALAAVHGLTDNPIFKKGNSSASGAMDA